MKNQYLINALSKGFILLSALALFCVSLMAFTNPQSVMDLVRTKLNNTDAFNSIRGVYGGVSATIIIALIYLLRNNVALGLAFLAILWGLYALSRTITIFVEGGLGEFGSTWLIIESILCIIALLLYTRRQKSLN